MEKLQMTREEVYENVKKIMTWDFENDGEKLLNEVVDGICASKSVVIDATAYIGNGKYVPLRRKDRYKYKMIVPAVDKNKSIFSTDLYSGDMKFAIEGQYGIYTYTRQLVIKVLALVEPDISLERLMHREAERGFFMLEVA
jgi:hypothetical protein